MAVFRLTCNYPYLGILFLEILHLKDLGDAIVISECSLCVNLVIEFFYVVSDIWIKFESNRTIIYGDIAF